MDTSTLRVDKIHIPDIFNNIFEVIHFIIHWWKYLFDMPFYYKSNDPLALTVSDSVFILTKIYGRTKSIRDLNLIACQDKQKLLLS